MRRKEIFVLRNNIDGIKDRERKQPGASEWRFTNKFRVLFNMEYVTSTFIVQSSRKRLGEILCYL
ncbi:hypothetical protein HR11_10255 [Porphyromonas macacae]|nr:hypothetical protein HR11_10255 [Porphyromonas macacae]